ncbi:hypothetical protein M0R72_05110 [Candidatus Pacearchaeota archaeon]|jgi:hypothetical protein|nr:hypothetical protein [Candidatus Pacearchaeota archaeon]
METEELIKLILGILVVAVVATGVSIYFSSQVIGFFKGLSGTASESIYLGLLK